MRGPYLEIGGANFKGTLLTLILPTLFFNISSCRQHAQKLLSLIFAVHRQV